MNRKEFYIQMLITFITCSVYASVIYETSFEQFEPVEFKVIKTGSAQWITAAGKVEIKTDAKKGKHCLHLLGGDTSSVELVLPVEEKIYEISFWAERWTSRNPFSFRIMAFQSGRWREIYDGDKTIKVGRRFLTHVSFKPDNCITDKLRFICSSPENTGIMIDELRIERPSKMKLNGVRTKQVAAPVLIEKKGNSILQIQVDVSGNTNPLLIDCIKIDTEGTTDLADIDRVGIFYTGNEETFSMDAPFCSLKKPSDQMVFFGKQTLMSEMNNFWVSYKLKKTAGLLNKVDAKCTGIGIDGNVPQFIIPQPDSDSIKKRIGHSLRDGGDDGVSVYRIPGLATTSKGTLIAVYDVRHHGWGDLPGNIDIGMSRSVDKGQSWEQMKIIMDMGPPHEKNGIGDPSVLVDRITGTIWVAALWSKGNNGWSGSGPGIKPDETGQFMLTKSEDDGLTWSDPINITSQIKNPKWRLLLQGPGKGITKSDGTLIFPAQFKDENNVPHSTIIFSRDHGKTWHIGTGAKSKTTEAQVVELNDGSLMLNMRDDRGGSRSVYITRDMGQTWQVHSTSRKALPEPVCMASLIRFSSTLQGDMSNILLFSNPAVNVPPRRRITIQASTDEGMTWPQKYHKLIHEPSCAGYSCMTRIDDYTIGILYEGGQTAHLVFEKFDISEIMGKQ